MTEIIGYKVLEKQAAPFDFKEPGNVASMKRKIRKLFDKAKDFDKQASSIVVRKNNNKTKSNKTLLCASPEYLQQTSFDIPELVQVPQIASTMMMTVVQVYVQNKQQRQ